MAEAIDYKDIRELAVSGYSAPIKPGLILPFGLESKYFSEEDAQKYGAWFNPQKAKADVLAAGYVPEFGPNGELIQTKDAQGNRVPTFYIKSPTGWSDWESIVRIAVKSMRSVGIDVRERFVDANLFWQALYAGDFDVIMYTPAPEPTPSQPWSRFQKTITSKDWAPEGEKMFVNYGRFNNPKAPDFNAHIEELITKIPVHQRRTRAHPRLPRAQRPVHAISADHSARVPARPVLRVQLAPLAELAHRARTLMVPPRSPAIG